MAKWLCEVIHSEMTHYVVEADTKDEAFTAAEKRWESQDEGVILGNEWAGIDSMKIDPLADKPTATIVAVPATEAKA